MVMASFNKSLLLVSNKTFFNYTSISFHKRNVHKKLGPFIHISTLNLSPFILGPSLYIEPSNLTITKQDDFFW